MEITNNCVACYSYMSHHSELLACHHTLRRSHAWNDNMCTADLQTHITPGCEDARQSFIHSQRALRQILWFIPGYEQRLRTMCRAASQARQELRVHIAGDTWGHRGCQTLRSSTYSNYTVAVCNQYLLSTYFLKSVRSTVLTFIGISNEPQFNSGVAYLLSVPDRYTHWTRTFLTNETLSVVCFSRIWTFISNKCARGREYKNQWTTPALFFQQAWFSTSHVYLHIPL